MKFYSISSFENAGTRYAWASGYGPVDQMPFFDSFPDEVKNMKLASWKINNSNPGIKIDQEGRAWSDILGCGNSPPGEFFSEEVIGDLRREGIPFLRATEVPIGTIRSKWLREIPPPRYYVLEAPAQIKIRHENIPIEEQIAASKENPPRWLGPFRSLIELSTWSGEDLFSPWPDKALTALYCTEKVKKLSDLKGWTNIKFSPVPTVD